jgi:fumarylacetoacetate (FAA) hydrolase
MKLVTYAVEGKSHPGLLENGAVYALHGLMPDVPEDIISLLRKGDEAMQQAAALSRGIRNGSIQAHPVLDPVLMAPIPLPGSCRDAYAFRQHVETSRKNRGLGMIPEFDQFPVFYFTNHNAIVGPGEVHFMPDHFRKLDFELEVAIVIGKKGRNIRASEADEYIAGYTIMNDLSARTLQMEEMLLSLGPAKGKDFATALGPWLVTPEELEKYKVPAREGHTGCNHDLKMRCWVNGKLVSEGTLRDMDWTFAEIIERCSYGVDLFPGDVIGSGTVGTGCFLELNGTGRRNDPDYREQWLQEGDIVTMAVEGLGILENIIRAEHTDWSILEQKKNL